MNNSVSNINKERYATEVQEFGHHGEILQGVFEGDDGKLHRGLITLKCKLFSSTAIYVRTKDPNIVSVMPEKKKKALVAAASTLKYIGKNIKYGGYLILQSNMPEEMGFGSSTCAWALVAVPCGTSVDSVTPVMTPSPHAHCRADTAYSLTASKSVKLSMFVLSPIDTS